MKEVKPLTSYESSDRFTPQCLLVDTLPAFSGILDGGIGWTFAVACAYIPLRSLN